jgi:hypothetical protein
VAEHTNAGTDKPILAVRGPHVYVAFNHTQKIWVSASHDGGATFTSVNVNKTGKLGWALAGGGVVDSAGNVMFGWAGYEQNGGAKGKVNLFVSRSTDGGVNWDNTVLDVSGAPPDCSASFCGWAYLGAQVTLAVDGANTVYALWNAHDSDKQPNRIYFAKSSNGTTWSQRALVSLAPAGAHHAFRWMPAPPVACGTPTTAAPPMAAAVGRPKPTCRLSCQATATSARMGSVSPLATITSSRSTTRATPTPSGAKG